MNDKLKHEDYVTHIKNKEDYVYLKSKHFPVNMRLFRTSVYYKQLILDQCEYIRMLCLAEKEGYKKPHGMSSANAGLAFNIIGVTIHRNTNKEYCAIMINPKILGYGGKKIISNSNCGSLTLDEPIKVERSEEVFVEWYDERGEYNRGNFDRSQGSLTIQHEIDHNEGILITDRKI